MSCGVIRKMRKVSTVWKQDTDNVSREDVPKTFDPSLPVKTRDGRKVEILRVQPISMRILAFIEDEHNPTKWVLRTFYYDGCFYCQSANDTMICGDDLINCPPTKVRKEGWVNIYPVLLKYFPLRIANTSGVYATRIEADEVCLKAHRHGVPLPAATVKIEWEQKQ